MQSILYTNGIQQVIDPSDWHAVVLARGYRGIIFDCDGTLVNSCEAHFHAFQRAAMKQGRHMDRDWYFARTGLDRMSILKAFAQDVGGKIDITQAAQDSIAAFITNVDAVSAIPETVNLVKALGPSYPKAVGTNAETPVARASLEAAGLVNDFAHIVSISDGLAAKPAPDIFLKAASHLAYPAAQTLVFEDSDEGVSAARAANLDVIQLIDR